MLANNLFKDFIEIVIKKGVFSPEELGRSAPALTKKIEDDIADGKRIDRRAPWLSRVSGKGGPNHLEWENISLMEHLVSVARGAVVFGEMDLIQAYPDMDKAILTARLARIVAVGFLHDIDKILCKSRQDKISTSDIEDVMRRFHLDCFLSKYQAAAPETWFQAMIDRAETSRSGRIVPGGIMLNADDFGDAQYVHLADRMDSILAKEGAHAALAELQNFAGLRTQACKSGWKIIDIQQPLMPFLLDTLLTEISTATLKVTGLPPIFETHHDGRMIAAIPEGEVEKIVSMALLGVQNRFRSGVRVVINPRRYINIADARATLENLLGVMENERERQKTFPLNKALIIENKDLRVMIEKAASNSGFAITWPDFEKIEGATVSPLPVHGEERNVVAFKYGAVLSIVLRCNVPDDKKLADRTLSRVEREQQLMNVLKNLGVVVPKLILSIKHEMTRQSILALLVGGFAIQHSDVFDAIFGDSGLVEKWLNGDGNHAGINERIEDDVSVEYVEPIKNMVIAAINGHFIEGEEKAPFRCHFTNAPAYASDRYNRGKDGIYGLRVSAFSGRENRPESHRSSSVRGTWLSPLARSEHSLRFRLAPGNSDKTQILISSPATSGLFASLTVGNVHNDIEISAFEACTENAKKVKIPIIGVDRFTRRLRVARFETLETNLVQTIDLLIRLFKTSIRTCRPLHVFQGLPHPVRDRVYFDSLPREIERGLGKSGFRIEELEQVLAKLETWHSVAKTTGLGVRLATEMMDPVSRFGALCEAVLRLERMDDPDLLPLKGTLSTQTKEFLMKEQENPLVRYARAMTGYQRPMLPSDSQSVRERGMRLAIDAVNRAVGHGPLTRETIISAIIAEISNAADRESDKHFTRRKEGEPTCAEALSRAAEIFADEVWPEVFRERRPDSRLKMHAIGVYRAALDRAHQQRGAGHIVFPFT